MITLKFQEFGSKILILFLFYYFRVTSLSDRLDIEFVLIHQEKGQGNIKASIVLVGDVTDKICIMVDDMVDTGGTITRAANKSVLQKLVKI